MRVGFHVFYNINACQFANFWNLWFSAVLWSVCVHISDDVVFLKRIFPLMCFPDERSHMSLLYLMDGLFTELLWNATKIISKWAQTGGCYEGFELCSTNRLMNVMKTSQDYDPIARDQLLAYTEICSMRVSTLTAFCLWVNGNNNCNAWFCECL